MADKNQRLELQEKYGKDYTVFVANRAYQYAVSFCLEQIGELAKKLRDSGFASNYPELAWNEISGLRNRIAHGYDTIDLEMVFDISVSDIPELHEKCNEIISKM